MALLLLILTVNLLRRTQACDHLLGIAQDLLRPGVPSVVKSCYIYLIDSVRFGLLSFMKGF